MCEWKSGKFSLPPNGRRNQARRACKGHTSHTVDRSSLSSSGPSAALLPQSTSFLPPLAHTHTTITSIPESASGLTSKRLARAKGSNTAPGVHGRRDSTWVFVRDRCFAQSAQPVVRYNKQERGNATVAAHHAEEARFFSMTSHCDVTDSQLSVYWGAR